MTKKRRMFDIEMPVESDGPAPIAPQTFPAGKEEERPLRRGPMAAAIAETVSTSRDRQEIEARIRAENDALAHAHVRLKKLGLVVDLIALDRIEMFKLVRDRRKGDDPDLAELKTSIAEVGLSNPIRVEERADGQYELIQGYRRLSAFRALLEETGDADRYAAIPAAVMPQGEGLEGLYRRMVDENLVRKDISFAEMAQLALDYALDPETEENDPDKAVAVLFKSAGYQKRSYIRAFIRVLKVLGKDLIHAPEIPRALGTALAARLEQEPEVTGLIRSDLQGWDGRSVQDELAVLRRFANGEEAAEGQGAPAPRAPAAPRQPRAKTSFQFDRAGRRAKCVAAAGKLEILIDRDFSTLDRRRLEQAVRLLLDQLEG